MPYAKIVLTVHDEIIVLAPKVDADNIMEYIITLMCEKPAWAKQLPLDAEGGYDVCYSK